MNISPINFTAKISRNWDGVYSQDTKQVIAEYDKSIQAIQTKREEFLELDRFMKSKEIKPYLQNLPAKDKINIVTNENEEENQSESKTKLEYLAMSDSSIYKIFSTTPVVNRWSIGEFKDIRKEDGTLNKDGIKKWLEYLVNFFI